MNSSPLFINGQHIIMSVTNDISTDQRVHKIATTLMKLGLKVTIVGRLLKNSLPLQREYKTHRMKLFFTKGALFYAEFNIRLFFWLLFQKCDILTANDLDTLLANYLVSKLRKKKLVYDSHEYFTEVPELLARPRVREVWLTIEKNIFPKLKYVSTVNDSIAGFYEERYKIRPVVIRNIANKLILSITKTKKSEGFPEDKYLIIMQGGAINVDRGGEELLSAMLYIDNAILLFAGSGDKIPELKKMCTDLQLNDKVKFIPRMPYLQLMEYTSIADIGVSLDKDTNPNYKYSLPNKLFDYIQAGVPILCSRVVEVAAIVQNYNLGMVCKSYDPKEIAAVLQTMLANKENLKYWRENAKKAADELCWENEQTKVIELYKPLIISQS